MAAANNRSYRCPVAVTFITRFFYSFLQLASMEKQTWDKRYTENQWVYGTEPNRFFKQFIDTHKPGRMLMPGEGEGRNAVYAAKKGWEVDAFDFSEAAQQKALRLARAQKVHLNYWVQSMESFQAGKQYDAVGLIYLHLSENIRRAFHQQVYASLASGGFLVLEAFAKEQLLLASGGPIDIAWLYDAPTLCGDFPFLHLISCGQKEVALNEGPFHQGKAAVLQIVGQKL